MRLCAYVGRSQFALGLPSGWTALHVKVSTCQVIFLFTHYSYLLPTWRILGMDQKPNRKPIHAPPHVLLNPTLMNSVDTDRS
jgi:hypothetical protein